MTKCRVATFDLGKFSRRCVWVDPRQPIDRVSGEASRKEEKMVRVAIQRLTVGGSIPGVQRGGGNYRRRRVRMVGSDLVRRARSRNPVAAISSQSMRRPKSRGINWR
jgi:hypothetical protein